MLGLAVALASELGVEHDEVVSHGSLDFVTRPVTVRHRRSLAEDEVVGRGRHGLGSDRQDLDPRWRVRHPRSHRIRRTRRDEFRGHRGRYRHPALEASKQFAVVEQNRITVAAILEPLWERRAGRLGASQPAPSARAAVRDVSSLLDTFGPTRYTGGMTAKDLRRRLRALGCVEARQRLAPQN